MKAASRFFRGTLAYDGTRYVGFQRQAGSIPTIQAAVEAAITAITQQQVTIKAAGRTDTGVHATGQVIAFECGWNHPVEALWRAININLPSDIALKDLQECQPGFSPRYDALSRKYIYQLYSAPVRDPLRNQLWWYVGNWSLDDEAMQAAANMLLGTHDFATFGQPPQGEVTLRTMLTARVHRLQEGDYHLTFEANAFLKHMVRSLVGTLIEVGRRRMSVEDFASALAAADRSLAGTTAPPQGLILVHVSYGE